MKRKSVFFVLILAGAAFVSCTENAITNASLPLQASKITTVKIGEPVLFTFAADSSAKKIEWSANPASYTKLTASGKTAQIRFDKSGKYTVSATNQEFTSSTTVTVDKTIYQPADSTNTDVPGVDNPNSLTPLTGEELTLTPYLTDSSAAPILKIVAVTSKNYRCPANDIITESSNDNHSFKISYSGVFEDKNCVANPNKAYSTRFFNHFAEGSNSLEIELNGTVYKGTITRTGKSLAINWPYNSGVKFLPLITSK